MRAVRSALKAARPLRPVKPANAAAVADAILPVVAPGILVAFRTARGRLPLPLRRQTPAGPGAAGLGLEEADADHRLVRCVEPPVLPIVGLGSSVFLKPFPVGRRPAHQHHGRDRHRRWPLYRFGYQFTGSEALDEAYVPFFGGFGTAWDDAMVARWSADPLAMLWPGKGSGARGVGWWGTGGRSATGGRHCCGVERADATGQVAPSEKHHHFFRAVTRRPMNNR